MNNLTKRLISSFIIAVGVLYACIFDHWNWLFVFLWICFFALGGLWEFYSLSERNQKERPFYKTGLILGFCFLLHSYACFLHGKRLQGHEFGWLYNIFIDSCSLQIEEINGFFWILALFTLGVIHLIRPSFSHSIYSIAVTLVGLIYTVFTFSHIFSLLLLPDGKCYLTLFLIIPIATDTGGYFLGRWFGRHTVGLRVSPNKTYEGYIGGIVLSLCTALVFMQAWKWWTQSHSHVVALGYGDIVILSFSLSLVAILGDLLASSFKRASAVSDSSNLIPGHGGLLDLLDSMYFSVPFGYFYLIIFHKAVLH